MRYEGDIYRQPGEWQSYILQATIGCSNNKCTFCGMYKDKRFRIRPMQEILEDIRMARMTPVSYTHLVRDSVMVTNLYKSLNIYIHSHTLYLQLMAETGI